MGAALYNRLDSCVYVKPAVFTKPVAATGTPESIAAAHLYFRKAIVFGKKGARTDNVGNVWIGLTSANDTPLYLIEPGLFVVINAPLGCKYSFVDWWVDVATADDGVMVIWS